MASDSIRQRLAADTEAAAKSYRLASGDVPPIMANLRQDARDLHYSALISFLDALAGAQLGYFTWATIKLYYVCFYAARIILAINNVALFYVGQTSHGKPFSLDIRTDNSPHKERGVTHQVVWSVMERVLSQHPLLGDIGLERAYMWMKNLREQVNYRNPRFSDPLVPPHFGQLDEAGIPRAVESYALDTQMQFALDRDHAALAFPVACLKHVQVRMANSGLKLGVEDRDCLAKRMLDIQLSDTAIAILAGK